MTVKELREKLQERIEARQAYLRTQGNVYVVSEVEAEIEELRGVVALIDGKPDPWGKWE